MRSPLRAEVGGRSSAPTGGGPRPTWRPGRLSHGQPMASRGPRGPEHDRDGPRALPPAPSPAPMGAEAQSLWTGHVSDSPPASSQQMV